jgi:hypothetical protein
MWINGSDHPKFEICIPERSELIMGIDPTLKPNIIRQTIENISNVEIELEMLWSCKRIEFIKKILGCCIYTGCLINMSLITFQLYMMCMCERIFLDLICI